MTEKTEKTERNAQIRRMHAEGWGTHRLSNWFGVTRQRVRQILGEIPPNGTIHGPVVPKIDKPKEI